MIVRGCRVRERGLVRRWAPIGSSPRHWGLEFKTGRRTLEDLDNRGTTLTSSHHGLSEWNQAGDRGRPHHNASPWNWRAFSRPLAARHRRVVESAAGKRVAARQKGWTREPEEDALVMERFASITPGRHTRRSATGAKPSTTSTTSPKSAPHVQAPEPSPLRDLVDTGPDAEHGRPTIVDVRMAIRCAIHENGSRRCQPLTSVRAFHSWLTWPLRTSCLSDSTYPRMPRACIPSSCRRSSACRTRRFRLRNRQNPTRPRRPRTSRPDDQVVASDL